MTRTLAVFALLTLAGAAPAQTPDAHLSLTRNAAGNVIATVEGTVRACGITASNRDPTFVVHGNVVEVSQSTLPIACMNPPPITKPYRRTLDLGRLPSGKYTIHWNLPELSGDYVVPAD
jgi:hypothetical protein